MQIKGFSKLNKIGKLKWIVENFFKDPEQVMKELKSFWLKDESQQQVLDGFSENTISNFILPYGVAPNFLINDKSYVVPMVIEESSVVAAASAAAKFWYERGGFKAEILGTTKVGHVHFIWNGVLSWFTTERLQELEAMLKAHASPITTNMENRGGGVKRIEVLKTDEEVNDLFQLRVHFETCDSMGANFINSVLEDFAETLPLFMSQREDLEAESREVEVIMSILSNYTPECLVRASVSCNVKDLESNYMDGPTFARRFHRAVEIARLDPYRATTHNKGIFNGVDAVILATGNDFRAVEACGHAYAAKDGRYKSLSNCTLENGQFTFWIDLPLAIGTVGGLTKLHPMAKRSLELLNNPTATELMQIVASVGLAQNFMAVSSLVTTGIQKGHMKLHLLNILNHLQATKDETEKTVAYFADQVVSFAAVREYVAELRS